MVSCVYIDVYPRTLPAARPSPPSDVGQVLVAKCHLNELKKLIQAPVRLRGGLGIASSMLYQLHVRVNCVQDLLNVSSSLHRNECHAEAESVEALAEKVGLAEKVKRTSFT